MLKFRRGRLTAALAIGALATGSGLLAAAPSAADAPFHVSYDESVPVTLVEGQAFPEIRLDLVGTPVPNSTATVSIVERSYTAPGVFTTALVPGSATLTLHVDASGRVLEQTDPASPFVTWTPAMLVPFPQYASGVIPDDISLMTTVDGVEVPDTGIGFDIRSVPRTPVVDPTAVTPEELAQHVSSPLLTYWGFEPQEALSCTLLLDGVPLPVPVGASGCGEGLTADRSGVYHGTVVLPGVDPGRLQIVFTGAQSGLAQAAVVDVLGTRAPAGITAAPSTISAADLTAQGKGVRVDAAGFRPQATVFCTVGPAPAASCGQAVADATGAVSFSVVLAEGTAVAGPLQIVTASDAHTESVAVMVTATVDPPYDFTEQPGVVAPVIDGSPATLPSTRRHLPIVSG